MPGRSIIYESELYNFSQGRYSDATKLLFKSYETNFRKIEPGESKKVGLKIYTHSGLGLATPKELVRAVIKELGNRGFSKENIFLVDEREVSLRDSGYLPTYGQDGSSFEGVEVIALDREGHYHKDWFYESPLEPYLEDFDFEASVEERRKSYLPTVLLWGIDYWINLPVVTSHRITGVAGALTNYTLNNISNNRRFWRNPANASLAIAEIAAIPELKEKFLFTIVSLEKFQYVGGFKYNERYTSSESKLWMSTNPALIDFLMLEKINKHRKAHNLPIIRGLPLFFKYCQELKVAEFYTPEDKIVTVLGS